MSGRNQAPRGEARVCPGAEDAAERVAHRGDLALRKILPEREPDRAAGVDGGHRERFRWAFGIRRMRMTAWSPPAQGADLFLRERCRYVGPIIRPEDGQRGTNPVAAETGRQ